MAATRTRTTQFSAPDKATKEAVAELKRKATETEAYNSVAQKLLKPPARIHDQQLSPDDANYIIVNFEYPRQRTVSTAWAAELGTLIEEGQLEPTEIHFAHCKADGNMYLIDGYHRLAGLAMGKRPFVFPVTHHYCETIEEVDTVYGRLDQGRPRRIAAAVRATSFDAKVGLPEEFIEKVSAAAMAIKCGFRAPYFSENRRSATLKMEIVEKWQKEARIVHTAMAGGQPFYKQKLKNVAFLSVCLAIAKYQPEKASEFIGEIARNECQPNTGSKAFVDALVHRGRGWGRNVAEQSRILAYSWNAYFEGRQTDRVMGAQDSKRPMDLLGTPWAGPRIYQSGPNMGKVIQPYEQHTRVVKPAAKSEE